MIKKELKNSAMTTAKKELKKYVVRVKRTSYADFTVYAESIVAAYKKTEEVVCDYDKWSDDLTDYIAYETICVD